MGNKKKQAMIKNIKFIFFLSLVGLIEFKGNSQTFFKRVEVVKINIQQISVKPFIISDFNYLILDKERNIGDVFDENGFLVVYKKPRQYFNISCCRCTNITYFVDGIKVIDDPNLFLKSTNLISRIPMGVSAEYNGGFIERGYDVEPLKLMKN